MQKKNIPKQIISHEDGSTLDSYENGGSSVCEGRVPNALSRITSKAIRDSFKPLIYMSCPELCFCLVWFLLFTFFEPLNGSG
jgi:hypothetical protein